MVIAQGLDSLRRRLPEILEDADNGLSGAMREMLYELGEEVRHLDERIERLTARVRTKAVFPVRLVQRLPSIHR